MKIDIRPGQAASGSKQPASSARYVKITFAGDGWCICEPASVGDLTSGVADYALTDVWMTPEEFQALPEFNG